MQLARIDTATKTLDPTTIPLPDELISNVPFPQFINSDIVVLRSQIDDANHWLAESPDGHTLAVASDSGNAGSVTFIDVDANTDALSVINSVNLDLSPGIMVFNQTGTRLYVAGQPAFFGSPQAWMLELNNGTWSIADSVSWFPWGLIDIPACMVLTPDESKLYIGAFRSPVLKVLDAQTMDEITDIELPLLTDFGVQGIEWNARRIFIFHPMVRRCMSSV